MAKVQELRSQAPDSEKITINLGHVDLGHVDLLIQSGFYSNRSDFIRTAIRNQITRHDEVVAKSIERLKLDIGLRRITRDELETARAAGMPLEIQVLGLATISSDVTPELARAAITSLRVLGTLQASNAVKEALRDRLA